MQLGTGLLCGEAPADGTMRRIAFRFESGDAAGEGGSVSYPPREAAAFEDGDLDLGLVEPTAMLWGVVELEALQNASCLGWGERLVERACSMGIEIVLNHAD